MAAYAALISLKNTIDHILQSSCLSLVDPSTQILQLAYTELQPFQNILERLDDTSKRRSRKKVNALDGRIKETIWEFEDLLESLLFNQILSQSERDVLLFSIDLRSLKDAVDSFIKMLKLMEKEYICELDNMPEDSISSRIGFDATKSKMIGLSDQFEQVKDDLIHRYTSKRVHTLIGIAGVGKTTLAKEIYQDSSIKSRFERRAWIKVGRVPHLDQVSRGILAQLCGITQGDEEIDENELKRLEGKKCLIVLDDVWEAEVLDFLLSSLPAEIRGGEPEILLTARDRNVIRHNWQYTNDWLYILVRFLNEKESKDLLCEKVFGEETCPPQLDKAAAKIAKNCEGLPLTIVTVADILSKSHNRDPEFWNDM